MLTSETKMSEAETDALLETVNAQIASETFDSNNLQLLKQMVESFGDSRGMVRLGFAEALGQVGTPATPVLVEALGKHENPVVRRAAAKTLTLIADPNAVPDLVSALLNDEDTVVQCSSVGALARTGEAAVPALLEILGSDEHTESGKGLAAWALAFIGVEAKELVYAQINSDSPTVRAAVVGAIAKIAQEESDEQALELLVQALFEPAASVRCEAAAALGGFSYRPAIPNLLELLKYDDGESRKAAALALMKIGDISSLESLKAALSTETEMGVKQAIQLAVSQIESKN